MRVNEAPLVSVRQVTKAYAQADGSMNEVLAPIDLDIPGGQFVSLLGPSGCGKSTLLNMMASLARPTTGKITFGGEERPRPDRTRGFVFQEAALFPWRTVLDNVGIALENETGRAKARTRARQYLALVGLASYADYFPHQLSGGMRQRVMIARSLAMGSKTLLMDEPFGALDALTRESMQEELLRIWQDSGTTVVFVTHSIEEAIYLSQRVIVLSTRPARVVEDCTIDAPYPRAYEIRNAPEVAELRSHLHGLLSINAGQAAPSPI